MVYVDTGAGVGAPDAELTNDARLDIPSTVICTGYTCKEYRDAVEAGYDFVLGLRDLRDLTYVDLPTSHWPMWSKPRELAEIIAGIAREHAAEPQGIGTGSSRP